MKIFTKIFKDEFLIYIFIIIFFFYSVANFINLGPLVDQAGHIVWFQNLKNTKYLFTIESITDIQKFLIDENGFLYQLLKPAYNSGDYHAYLFQINSVLTVLLFSFLLNFNPIETYNITSIFFSSFAILINYKILIFLLKDYKFFKDKLENKIIYQLIFCVVNISYYKFYFSPLGHHNLGYFFFSLTILFFLNGLNKNISYFYFKLGVLTSFVIFFQVTLALLLLPFLTLSIFFKKFRVNKENFQNFLKFSPIVFIAMMPFIILIINDLIKSDENFLSLLIGRDAVDSIFYLKKIIMWFSKMYTLSSPIIFFSFIYSIFICLKNKKHNFLYLIILIHFMLHIMLGIFYISYLRNFYYIFNLILILSAFTFIYIYQSISLKFRIFIPLSLLFINTIYNLNIIFEKNNLFSEEKLMYQYYFEDKGDVSKKIEHINNSLNKNKIVFLGDLEKNFFLAYNYDLTKKNMLIDKPFINLSNHAGNNSAYSKYIIKKNKITNGDFYLISLSEPKNKFIDEIKIFNKLKNFNIINQNCFLLMPHEYKSFIFRPVLTAGPYKKVSNNDSIEIYLTKIICD